MEYIEVNQGSEEWLAVRRMHYTASEAPAAMGDSLYMSRDRLLAIKYGGEDKEPVHPAVQRRFDAGHQAEADIRPVVERIMACTFKPVVGVRDGLLASFDGLTDDRSMCFEHKLLNDKLAKMIIAEDLHEHYRWQMDQQMFVSGAGSVLFVASDGTEGSMLSMLYWRDESRIERLKAGWKQFAKDLEAYKPRAPLQVVKPEPGERFLPEVKIQAQAIVTYTNIDYFVDAALAQIDAVNTNLVSDQDFAAAEADIKWLGSAEKRVADAMSDVLAQCEELSQLLSSLELLGAVSRELRLKLDKQVRGEKKRRQDEIIAAAVAEVGNEERLREAGKGKRTMETFSAAVNDEVARIKIEPIEPAPFKRAHIIEITYKDLKSGPRILSVEGIEFNPVGDGKTKTIEIGV